MTVDFDFLGVAVPPRDAATVLLLRDSPHGGSPEVFFVKRNADVHFMGGAYVFPGGSVDPGDFHPDIPTDLSATEASLRLGDTDPARAHALHVAALRECLEESGVVLATSPVPDAISVHLRTALSNTPSPTFASLLIAAGVTLSTRSLVPFARWVTPRVERKRFDARFFLARCPANVGAVHDGGETVASLWLTPREALARARARQIVVAPPTWRTLESISKATSVSQLLARSPPPLLPLEPSVALVNNEPTVIFPPSSDAPTTRFAYADGAWIPAD